MQGKFESLYICKQTAIRDVNVVDFLFAAN